MHNLDNMPPWLKVVEHICVILLLCMSIKQSCQRCAREDVQIDICGLWLLSLLFLSPEGSTGTWFLGQGQTKHVRAPSFGVDVKPSVPCMGERVKPIMLVTTRVKIGCYPYNCPFSPRCCLQSHNLHDLHTLSAP